MNIIECILLLAIGVDALNKWAPGHAEPVNRAANIGLPARLEINARLRIATRADDDRSYRVDEYIDRPNSRVTIRLQDQSTGLYATYYRLGDPHQLDTITQFDETKQECTIEKISSQWRLQKLSKLVSLLPDDYQMNVDPKLKSIVIGTGSILYIVMNKLSKKLTYESRTFDNERFTQLNYFSASFDLSEDQKNKVLNLTDYDDLALRVTVGMPLSVSQLEVHLGENLELATSNVMTQLDRVPYSIVMDIVDRGATADGTNGQDNKKAEPIYAVLIDYYMARPLDGNNNMLMNPAGGLQSNGHRFTEPFTLPLGLCCWLGHESSVYSLELDHDQFSAVYYDELASLQTANDVFYMAYDGKTKAFRYDSPGRKTILDLKRDWAYHISKNTQLAELEAEDQAADELGEPDNCFRPPISIDILQEQQQQEECKQQIEQDSKCSLIEMDRQTVGSQYKDLAHILGLSSMDRIYLMGQAEIDGLDCHVYERLVMPQQLPKIFGFRPIEAQMVYSLIVYVVHDNSLLDDELAVNYSTTRSWPKRLTLLSFDTVTKRRQIEASVIFTQFSWTLQVSPNEADSGVSAHLFDVDQCAPIRRGRAKLEFFVEQQGDTLYGSSKSDFLVESRWKTLKTRSQSNLQQWIIEHISESFGISRARVTNLELTFQRQAVLVRATLLELPSVHSEIKPLGYLSENYPAEQIAKLASKWQNTRTIHWTSLDECHLEGALSMANTITYCPNYNGMCIITVQTDMPLVMSSRFIRGSTTDKSFCSVYTIQQVSTHSKYPMNTLDLLLYDSHRLLTAKPISGKLKLLRDGQNNEIERKLMEFKFVARVESVKIGLMEPIQGVEALLNLSYMIGNRTSGDSINNSASSVTLYEQGSATNSSTDYYVTNISGPDVNQPVSLIYCHKACQLSDHCLSWSFCRKKSAQSWCTLTNLELTQAVLVDLSRLKTMAGARMKLPVEYSPPEVDDKRVYYLKIDDQCSLHSKDYYELYGKLTANDSVQLQPDQVKQFALVSLDECARLCFRHELPYDGKINSNSAYQVCENFVYCPVISLCHFDGLSGSDTNFYSQQTNTDPMKVLRGHNSEQQFNSRQQCHRYSRNYLQYFHKLPFLRLTLTDTSSASEIFSSSDVIARFNNLNFNQCIRHCVLADQRCLAFDYCQASMSSTCLIYTIRSPSATLIKNSPDNSSEGTDQYYYFAQQTTEANKPVVEYKVELRAEERCDHHVLINTYANVKLSLSKHKDFSNNIILEQDQYKSDNIRQSDLFADETTAAMIDNNKINNNMKASNQSIANCATFAIGLIMGMLIYLVVPSYVVRRVKRRQKKFAEVSRSTEAFRFRVFSLARNEQRQNCY